MSDLTRTVWATPPVLSEADALAAVEKQAGPPSTLSASQGRRSAPHRRERSASLNFLRVTADAVIDCDEPDVMKQTGGAHVTFGKFRRMNDIPSTRVLGTATAPSQTYHPVWAVHQGDAWIASVDAVSGAVLRARVPVGATAAWARLIGWLIVFAALLINVTRLFELAITLLHAALRVVAPQAGLSLRIALAVGGFGIVTYLARRLQTLSVVLLRDPIERAASGIIRLPAPTDVRRLALLMGWSGAMLSGALLIVQPFLGQMWSGGDAAFALAYLVVLVLALRFSAAAPARSIDAAPWTVFGGPFEISLLTVRLVVILGTSQVLIGWLFQLLDVQAWLHEQHWALGTHALRNHILTLMAIGVLGLPGVDDDARRRTVVVKLVEFILTLFFGGLIALASAFLTTAAIARAQDNASLRHAMVRGFRFVALNLSGKLIGTFIGGCLAGQLGSAVGSVAGEFLGATVALGGTHVANGHRSATVDRITSRPPPVTGGPRRRALALPSAGAAGAIVVGMVLVVAVLAIRRQIQQTQGPPADWKLHPVGTLGEACQAYLPPGSTVLPPKARRGLERYGNDGTSFTKLPPAFVPAGGGDYAEDAKMEFQIDRASAETQNNRFEVLKYTWSPSSPLRRDTQTSDPGFMDWQQYAYRGELFALAARPALTAPPVDGEPRGFTIGNIQGEALVQKIGRREGLCLFIARGAKGSSATSERRAFFNGVASAATKAKSAARVEAQVAAGGARPTPSGPKMKMPDYEISSSKLRPLLAPLLGVDARLLDNIGAAVTPLDALGVESRTAVTQHFGFQGALHRSTIDLPNAQCYLASPRIDSWIPVCQENGLRLQCFFDEVSCGAARGNADALHAAYEAVARPTERRLNRVAVRQGGRAGSIISQSAPALRAPREQAPASARCVVQLDVELVSGILKPVSPACRERMQEAKDRQRRTYFASVIAAGRQKFASHPAPSPEQSRRMFQLSDTSFCFDASEPCAINPLGPVHGRAIERSKKGPPSVRTYTKWHNVHHGFDLRRRVTGPLEWAHWFEANFPLLKIDFSKAGFAQRRFWSRDSR